MRSLQLGLILAFTMLISNLAYSSLTWQETQIPINTSNGTIKLEALLVFPNDKVPHPLALISPGSPRNASARPNMTALSYLPIANEFARRGYSVAVVLRRGYGSSEGGWAESFGPCKNPDYIKAAQAAAADLHATVDYLGTLKQFNTNKIIAVGVSAGGFATLAFTAINPPPGLKAAISFAGGRGSLANDTVCNADALTSAFAELGKTSRLPTLWVYAQNDHFFNPTLAEKLLSAFKASGGNATFIQAGAFGKEGHFLFSNAGISKWTPIVDNFLKSQNLALVDAPLPLPVSSLEAPSYLSNSAKQAFSLYKKNAPHKAFAVSKNGAYGWRSGQRTQEIAEKNAMDYCKQYSNSKECKLIAVDDKILR